MFGIYGDALHTIWPTNDALLQHLYTHLTCVYSTLCPWQFKNKKGWKWDESPGKKLWQAIAPNVF